jgi:putative tryptophan/tyrosine transport system substrate-binding protein
MLDMKRREFIALVGGGGLLLATKARRARAQQPAMPVVGFLEIRSPEMIIERLRAFRQGLRETGYVEGENVTIDYRWAEQMEQLPELAGALTEEELQIAKVRTPPARSGSARSSTLQRKSSEPP